MGIFYETVDVFNRVPWPLTVRFDGQEKTLQPGRNTIPIISLYHALNQNPIMGSQDADNPNVTGAEYLIGIIGKENKYPCTPLSDEELVFQKNNPSRYNYKDLIEPRLGKRDTIEVKGRKPVSTFEAKEPSLIGTDRND